MTNAKIRKMSKMWNDAASTASVARIETAGLGAGIEKNCELTVIKVDHIEAATATAMKFSGVWISKDMIAALHWLADAHGVETVTEIRIPAALAKRENL